MLTTRGTAGTLTVNVPKGSSRVKVGPQPGWGRVTSAVVKLGR
jgi:hypothetical protein